MDASAQKLLESVTQKTLHAHAFSRSSSQATFVLTDLLSRYLTLVTSTCAKYAQHSGRRQLSIRDAIQALDELGTSLEDLNEFGSTEAKELNRYALHSARRAEELNELRSQLSEGLRQDRDAIPLQFARHDEEEDEDDSDNDSGFAESDNEEGIRKPDLPSDAMDVDAPLSKLHSPQGQKRRLETPPLPPSPVSNSPSPSRKRARTANWDPPEHIPNFLPPFPSTEIATNEETQQSSPRASQPPELPLPPSTNDNPDKAPMSLSQAIATTSSSSDILVQVPYSQSTLANLPERHLPGPPPAQPPARQPRFQIPQTERSFIGAYHHILTHPAPPNPPPSTTQRHKVAMALLDLIQKSSRWTPADTLNASVSPCPPRVATMAPSYPVAITDLGSDGKPKEGKEDKTKFPAIITQRPVSYAERLAPMVSQPSSHIPNLSRNILHPAILNRTTRLANPPVLHRNSKPLVYGQGIPAPWNTAPLPALDAGVPATPSVSKPKEIPNGKEKDPDAPKPPMPDARLFATWDYETKDFTVPLPRNRNRVGSFASGSGVITLPNIVRKATK
ncbi:hypothetical protein FA15DRAFT_759368 [Coprinopsis marcescibilis]|uniref:Bromodomain associated domain-containing protein n=1 Tax=Coprinopsis marcescibilis TaxID=230819 RepID=A0A5C3KKH8_COPMA|nr:hypothetical protein FA15DRAFT_759368 [Coprinopsis marcescibilis]